MLAWQAPDRPDRHIVWLTWDLPLDLNCRGHKLVQTLERKGNRLTPLAFHNGSADGVPQLPSESVNRPSRPSDDEAMKEIDSHGFDSLFCRRTTPFTCRGGW
jgi:hypothetical protein